MRKTITLLMLSLSLFACSKSGDNTNTKEEDASLIGRWNYVKQRIQKFDSKGVVSDITTTNFPGGDYLLYNADGSGSANSFDDKAAFTYTFTDGIITEKEDGKVIGSYVSKINGKTLTKHSEYTENSLRVVYDLYLEKQ